MRNSTKVEKIQSKIVGYILEVAQHQVQLLKEMSLLFLEARTNRNILQKYAAITVL